MEKESRRSIISIMASLLLAIFLTILSLLISVKVGFTTIGKIIDVMDSVNYFEKSYDDMISNCESLAIPYGLKAEVFEGVFTEDDVRYDGHMYLRAAITGGTYTPATDEHKQRLIENVNKYVVDNNLVVNGSADEIINEFASQAIDEYDKAVELPYISVIGFMYKAMDKVLIPGVGLMTIFSLVCVVILTKQNPHKKNRIFRYMAYSTASAAVSVLVIPIMCYFMMKGKYLLIYPEYMYDFMNKYFRTGLSAIRDSGIFLLIMSFVMIGLSSYIKYRYIHHPKKSKRR